MDQFDAEQKFLLVAQLWDGLDRITLTQKPLQQFIEALFTAKGAAELVSAPSKNLNDFFNREGENEQRGLPSRGFATYLSTGGVFCAVESILREDKGKEKVGALITCLKVLPPIFLTR